MPAPASPNPRVLVVLPTWLGDTVMATPTLRLLRDALPMSTIVALARPGLDDLLAGNEVLDDVLVADRHSVLGPAKVAARLMAFKFDAALLLPNSFASAITVRLAGIPTRVGYDRDGRGSLLTVRLDAPKRPPPREGWQPISAVDYYWRAGLALLAELGRPVAASCTHPGTLELHLSPGQEAETCGVLDRANLSDGRPYAILNPGGNNPAKRWPVERFAGVAHALIARHHLTVAINGSPAEADLVALIRDVIVLDNPADEGRVVCLPEIGGTVGSLKGLIRRCQLVVTNDTGPRHIAAALGTRCITLFGPTDPRWTTLPEAPPRDGQGNGPRERVIVADPTLPEDEVADDHPQRCRIDRIATSEVLAAVEAMLST